MRKRDTVLCVMSALFLTTAAARADWPNENITKWVQEPDRVTGMDVHASFPYAPGANFGKILADDFLCTLSGPITDIHIWGSWLNDRLPLVPDATGQLVPDPSAVEFKLSFH